jgi:hypothetical protein
VGARRLTIALSAVVALALVLGTADISLVAAGVPVPPPLDMIFVTLAVAVVVLYDRLRSIQILDEVAAVRREITAVRTDMDERDGRIYAALVRRSSEPTTVEIPRPRVVATVPAIGTSGDLVEMPSPTTVEAMRRLARKVTDA